MKTFALILLFSGSLFAVQKETVKDKPKPRPVMIDDELLKHWGWMDYASYMPRPESPEDEKRKK